MLQWTERVFATLIYQGTNFKSMKLLNIQEIKKNKERMDEEHQKRIDKLNKEETLITKRFNICKFNIESEKKLLDSQLKEYHKLILDNKTKLSREIKTLENRRKDLLKPINEIKEISEKREKDVEKKEKDIKIIENILKNDKEELIERIENIIDREKDVETKEKELDLREESVKKLEEETKKSSIEIAKNWLKYHKSVIIFNKEIEQKEKDVENQKNTNQSYSQELDKKAKEQENINKLIKDKYETLNRTINRINKQYGGSKIRL